SDLRRVNTDADLEWLSVVRARIALKDRRHRDRDGCWRNCGWPAEVARRSGRFDTAKDAKRDAVAVRRAVAACDLVEIERTACTFQESAEQTRATKASLDSGHLKALIALLTNLVGTGCREGATTLGNVARRALLAGILVNFTLNY